MIARAYEYAYIIAANRGSKVEEIWEGLSSGKISSLFDGYISKNSSHIFYKVEKKIIMDKVYTKKYTNEWVYEILVFENGKVTVQKARSVNLDKLSPKSLLKLYKNANLYKDVNGLFYFAIDHLLRKQGWRISRNGLSINFDGIITGGMTGETNHDINPPERIIYWHEMVNIDINDRGGIAFTKNWEAN